MLFSINITRDWVDFAWGWGNFTGVFIIPFLIWFFGSSRMEANKENQQQNERLNYLIMLINRYFQYLQTLDGIISSKKEEMARFINNPTEESKMNAFHQLVPPILDFDLKVSDYVFTINNQANLMNLLMKFTTLYDELQTHIKHYNNDAMHIYNPEIPMESFVRTAIGYRDLNFPNFLATIWLSQYILFRLFETVYGYEKFLKKSKIIASYVPPEGVNYFENVKIKLNNLYGNENWQKAYEGAIEPIKRKFYENIYKSFADKFFNKNTIENRSNGVPFPINWMLNFIGNHPFNNNEKR